MHYLFSFDGRINRAKMWLFILIAHRRLDSLFHPFRHAGRLRCPSARRVAAAGWRCAGRRVADPGAAWHRPLHRRCSSRPGAIDQAAARPQQGCRVADLLRRSAGASGNLMSIVAVIVLGRPRSRTSWRPSQRKPAHHGLQAASPSCCRIWAFVELYCLRGTMATTASARTPEPADDRGTDILIRSNLLRRTLYAFLKLDIVIARRTCVRATHLGNRRKIGSRSREEARPGDDGLIQ